MSTIAQPDALFDLRWQRSAPDLLDALTRLYGPHTDMEAFTARLRRLLAKKWQAHAHDLRALDLARDVMTNWFLSQEMVEYVFYIERFWDSSS